MALALREAAYLKCCYYYYLLSVMIDVDIYYNLKVSTRSYSSNFTIPPSIRFLKWPFYHFAVLPE